MDILFFFVPMLVVAAGYLVSDSERLSPQACGPTRTPCRS